MDINTRDGQTSIHFDSLIEYMDKVEGDIENLNNRKIFSNHRNGRHSKGWLTINVPRRKPHGWIATSAQDTVKNALLGNSEALDIAVKFADQLSSVSNKSYSQTQTIKRRKSKWTDFGDELDIHKVLQGRVDTAWRKTVRIESDSKHQLTTLMIDVGGNYHVTVKDSLWRAAVAYKVTDELIKSGKSVKVIIGSSCNSLVRGDYGRVVTTDIVVKQYNEPLSMERLAAMSNVAFHRVFNFSARAFMDESIDYSGSSIETLSRRPPLQMEDEIEQGHTRYLYIPRCTSEYDANKAIENINEQIKNFSKIGVN